MHEMLRRLCGPAAQSAMERLLGRAPVCPGRCLEADAPAEDASAGDAAEWSRPPRLSSAAPSGAMVAGVVGRKP